MTTPVARLGPTLWTVTVNTTSAPTSWAGSSTVLATSEVEGLRDRRAVGVVVRVGIVDVRVGHGRGDGDRAEARDGGRDRERRAPADGDGAHGPGARGLYAPWVALDET